MATGLYGSLENEADDGVPSSSNPIPKNTVEQPMNPESIPLLGEAKEWNEEIDNKHEEGTKPVPSIPPPSIRFVSWPKKVSTFLLGCLSDLTFQWFVPLLQLGNQKNQLQPDDLNQIPLPKSCSTKFISDRFQHYWKAQLDLAKDSTTTSDPFANTQQQQQQPQNDKTRNKKKNHWIPPPSLLMALFQGFGLEFIKAGMLKLVHDLCLFVGPQVLNGLIHFLRNPDAPLSQGLALTLLVTLSQLVMTFCLRHYFFKCYLTGLQLRSAMVVAVYDKALRLSMSERLFKTTGEITNLVSIDAQRMQDLTTYCHAIWYSFVQIGLALYFLWGQMGPASLGGVFMMIIMMPVTKLVAQWLAGIQRKVMTAKDQRIQLNSEILSSMKIVKLQAWEEPFQQRLLALRNVEMNELWNYAIAQTLTILMWSTTPLAVALATFGAYILSGHKLEVASALTALALFDILRFPLFMLPQVINRIVEASVSLNRIKSFLDCEEHIGVAQIGSVDKGGAWISMRNASFVHDSRKPAPVKGVAVDPSTKALLDKDWEIQLLKSQLRDIELELQLRSAQTDGVVSCDDNAHALDVDAEDVDSPDLLCLKRINFQCHRGELVAVVGGVGCGKSSFVNAILGEIRQVAGDTVIRGTVSYFSQSPFILNDTVRNNIVFGHLNEPIDEERYQACLTSCALTHDLKLLPAGDQTEIGEKGITLSGGQKARVSLARTMYHNADVAILDDPLAAVDAHVGKHIFEQCVLDQLLNSKIGKEKKKSVVLVTNALQYLNHPLVNRILVFQNGRVVEQGTYRDLATNPNSLFKKFLIVMEETGVTPTAIEGCHSPGVPLDAPTNHSSEEHEEEDPAQDIDNASPEIVLSSRAKGDLMTNEFQERVKGKVEGKVYLAWGRAAGGAWLPFALIGAYGLVEGFSVSSKWWLTYWSAHGANASQMYFFGIYALLNLATVVATALRILMLMNCGLRASRKIFEQLLSVVLFAPMSFFDTTPIGRIINRFSGDMNTLDTTLMETLRSYLSTLASIGSTIIVISIVTPVFTLCLIPIAVFYAMQQAYFTTTYRELKRLDSIGRSPIYALLGETLDGVSTIRAFSAQGTFSQRLYAMLDRQQHAYFTISAAQCWLGIRLEIVGTLIITFACLSSVLQHAWEGGNETFAGLAGLAISYALSVTQSMNWSVRMASDLEANMVAVERVEQYCSIPNEADLRRTQNDTTVSPDWPQHGEIEFLGAKLRYRPELPLVLKGLNLRIPAGSKVGVVGRTGAGKSTLMVALLRIVELCEGRILIDGIDHSQLGLAKVRSKIAVIPQDPVLFSGTIRSNLDPFEEYSDERLSDVLTRVGLISTDKPRVSSSNLSLSSSSTCHVSSLSDIVADGGSNYSVGQRQLLVIARALLCGSKIVILDEATAAVDADTDARIQKVLRLDFATATCLIVAHRIHTIMDSDYILVMKDGQAAEFDTPRNLLQSEKRTSQSGDEGAGGLFRELVNAASGH